MLLRSLLFVPGNDEYKTKKAFSLGADAVALDLEDAVAASQKVAARSVVARVLEEQVEAASLRVVRVNSFQTDLTEGDIREVYRSSLDAVLLPMVERGEEIERLEEILTELEAADINRSAPVSILALIETARGVLNAEALLQASESGGGDVRPR